MPRSRTPAPPPPDPELKVSPDEAKEKLVDRITKGRELQTREIRTVEHIDELEGEKRKWNSFNHELLKRLFTTDALADEYSRFYGGVISMGRPSPSERLESLRSDIGEQVHRLESIVERLELFPVSAGVWPARPVAASPKATGRRVFVVHGHDEAVRETTARFLEKLGLEAVVLHEQATGGRTIVEKLEHYSDVDFAVVLLTPDDVGASKADVSKLQARARQNVILELGYFVGKLSRAHVCALYRGPLELPSDILGVGYVQLDDAGSWRFSLAKELRAAGFPIDMNKVI